MNTIKIEHKSDKGIIITTYEFEDIITNLDKMNRILTQICEDENIDECDIKSILIN